MYFKDRPSLSADATSRAAEGRVVALEKTVASLQGNQADVAKSEANARQQLVKVQKELEKYQAVYGDASSMSADASHLSEQLQRKQEELDKLQLQDQQREQVSHAHDTHCIESAHNVRQAESALYAEIDKLSTAWEGLDRQVKNKVFDLSNMEERVTKLSTEVGCQLTSAFHDD